MDKQYNKKGTLELCKVCERSKTALRYNIDLRAVPICKACVVRIVKQEVTSWH